MSRWKDKFDGLAIHTTIANALAALDFETRELDSEVASELLRIEKAFELLQAILDGMDSELYPEAQLNSIANHLNQHVVAQISNYVSNSNVQHLKNANDQFDSQISTIFQMAGTSKPKESRKAIRGVEDAYEGFCKAVEITKNEFAAIAEKKETEISDLETRTTALSTILETLQSSTDTQVSSWQTEFTQAQTTRAEEHSEAQIERGKEYDVALREFKATTEKDRTEVIKKHDKALMSAFDKYAENVAAKTTDITEKHASILKIHGLVTNDGVAGGYKKGANSEWWAALVWSVISMLCYFLILAWVLFKEKIGFGVTATGGIDWPVVVTTLSVTSVAFVAAQFAGRQSRVHRMNEQRMRWFSFEIAAIDPFISSLPIEMQRELKKELSERLFGQDRIIEERAVKTRGLDTDAIKNIAEALKAVRE
jgi:hypothetical protein